jgi:hypothetical protein
MVDIGMTVYHCFALARQGARFNFSFVCPSSNSCHLFSQSAQRMREFLDPQFDSRFHCSQGNLRES